MPIDLAHFASAFNDSWAREQARKHLMELYEETRDWNKVRTLFLSEQASLL